MYFSQLISHLTFSVTLILSYGERLYSTTDIEEHTPNQVRGRIQDLKLLRQLSQMKVSTLSASLDVGNFDILVQCVRELAEFDDSTHQFLNGSLALRVGYSLNKCSQMKKTQAIKENNEKVIGLILCSQVTGMISFQQQHHSQ